MPNYLRDSSSLSIALHFHPTRGEGRTGKAGDMMSAAISAALFAGRLIAEDDDGTVSPDALAKIIDVIVQTASIVGPVSPFSNTPDAIKLVRKFERALFENELPDEAR